MSPLTERQREILAFIDSQNPPPTIRDVAAHFNFRSHTTAAQHIRALRTKGYLAAADGVSRGLKSAYASRGDSLLARIPIFGSIPAGSAIDSL